jgi:hypothetical protein
MRFKVGGLRTELAAVSSVERDLSAARKDACIEEDDAIVFRGQRGASGS